MGKLRVLDLFSGIGGFSLGLERAGMKTVAFCEIEEFPRKVLRKHWPEVPIYDDVRTLTAARLAADGIGVDVICGGFPCQDISNAGKGAGIEGARSGLWSEYARLIGEIRPQFVIVENVAALLGRGLSRVLGDLAEIGYDAEWHCIPASYVGAPHRRDRVWIVAHAGCLVDESKRICRISSSQKGRNQEEKDKRKRVWSEATNGGEDVADATSQRQPRQRESIERGSPAPRIDWEAINPIAERIGDIWRIEPNVGRVANGVPARVDRLKGLGNAVVPQIPEIIGRAIIASCHD